MPRHRFTTVVEIADEKESEDAENWDHQDLQWAIENGTAIITEVDDHEVFEDG
jgi:hypothetical protein